MAQALAARSADNLEPVRAGPLPHELRPMGAALDALFARVAAARDRERNFSAYAAHELKTPLSGIKTQAQVAAMAPDEESRRHALAQIERGVARTDRMVRQLLELASVDGAASAGGGVTDVGEVLASVASSLERSAEARDVELQCRVSNDLPLVAGDAVLATVAVRNVVENAIGASSAGDVVVVRVDEATDTLHVLVLDQGPGIAEVDRSRITERFFRGNHAPEAGSGLGLSIAAAAMQQIEGAIEFRRRDARGEQVTLTFKKRELSKN